MGSIVKEKRNIVGLLTRQDGGDNRFIYTCTRCGSEFELANELETHFQIHNEWMRHDSNATSDRMEVRESGEFSTQSADNQQRQQSQSQSHSSIHS